VTPQKTIHIPNNVLNAFGLLDYRAFAAQPQRLWRLLAPVIDKFWILPAMVVSEVTLVQNIICSAA